MSGLSAAIHGLRWLWYLGHLPVVRLYNFLVFLSKPGARVLVPAALSGLTILFFPQLQQWAFHFLHMQAENPAHPETLVFGFLVCLSALWLLLVLISRQRKLTNFLFFAVVLGWWFYANPSGMRYLVQWVEGATQGDISYPGVVFGFVLSVALALFSAIFGWLSRALALLLVTFPPLAAPLPPYRRLRVVPRSITPAPARLVVPHLPRRGRYTDADMRAALPPAVAATLSEP